MPLSSRPLTVGVMEELGHAPRKPGFDALERRSPRSLFGFRLALGSVAPRHALPSISRLASELCAQRGFEISLHGELPRGGTIISVDALDFDKSLVLLSLFDDARAYTEGGLDADAYTAQALSLRSCRVLAGTPVAESLVGDLACGRVAILDSAHAKALRSSGPGRAPVRRMYVDITPTRQAHVLTEI